MNDIERRACHKECIVQRKLLDGPRIVDTRDVGEHRGNVVDFNTMTRGLHESYMHEIALHFIQLVGIWNEGFGSAWRWVRSLRERFR